MVWKQWNKDKNLNDELMQTFLGQVGWIKRVRRWWIRGWRLIMRNIDTNLTIKWYI